MHLVTKAFRSVISKNPHFLSEAKIAWYEQILRIIALTHDLGHAPFSHASETVFPGKLQHEDFTEKIIKET
jgi:HD superfamily phosphohydrolase